MGVLEDGIVGGIAGGITHGIGKGITALRGKSPKTTVTGDAYISNAQALDSHAEKLARIAAVGKVPSGLTKKVGISLGKEAKLTFKNYLKAVGVKVLRDSTKTIIYGFTNTADLTELLKIIIPIDQTEDDVTLKEYIEAYFENIKDMVSKIEVCIEGGN